MIDQATICDRIHELLEDDYAILVPREAVPCLAWRETGLDSLPLMELVLALEREFDATVSNEALREVVTFGDLAAQIAQESACAS